MSYNNPGDPMGAYQEYVEKLQERNPSIVGVCRFLATPALQHEPCHIFSMDFFEHEERPVGTDLEFDGLYMALKEHDDHQPSASEIDLEAGIDPTANDKRGALQGRILIVENIDKRTMECLGSRLDIDPAFFAEHLRDSWSGTDANIPNYYVLPSLLRKRQFASIHHLRETTYGTKPPEGELSLQTNAQRSMGVVATKISTTEVQYVGLRQHCTSILLTEKKDPWLAIILVDRPIDHTYIQNSQPVTIPSRMYLGGYDDLFPISEPPFPTRLSLRSDIHAYWTHQFPPSFNRTNPSFFSIAYYPLRIVAAEWTISHTLMHHVIRQRSLSPITLSNVQASLEDPSADALGLEMLQRAMWRTTSSAQKVSAVIAMLDEQRVRTVAAARASEVTLVGGVEVGEDDERAALAVLRRDFEYILQGIENHRVRLESVLPLLMSLVEIVDTRRSLRETANVGRLSTLALIFVPLAYVASLFSMSERLGPGGDLFWVYFVVAVPVTAVVVLVARTSGWQGW